MTDFFSTFNYVQELDVKDFELESLACEAMDWSHSIKAAVNTANSVHLLYFHLLFLLSFINNPSTCKKYKFKFNFFVSWIMTF
uniref:Uncharacterized protein n=1 Tax=Ditylenchus dipsaci TaxID=166011 RepID=A0A915E4P2_9BILA